MTIKINLTIAVRVEKLIQIKIRKGKGLTHNSSTNTSDAIKGSVAVSSKAKPIIGKRRSSRENNDQNKSSSSVRTAKVTLDSDTQLIQVELSSTLFG